MHVKMKTKLSFQRDQEFFVDSDINVNGVDDYLRPDEVYQRIVGELKEMTSKIGDGQKFAITIKVKVED